MTLTLTIDGVLPLLNEDGATDMMLENGADMLTLEGGVEISAAALLYGTVTLKFNTLDFGTIDYPAPALGAAVTTTDPAWSGTVAATTTSDPVDLVNGRQTVVVTATNATALSSDTAPFDLSDVPANATFDYLLEDGTSHFLLESGTDFAGTTGVYLMEGSLAYGYRGLSVRKMAGSPPTTLAICTVEQPGLRPGNTVHLTSQNQGLNALALQVNQATLRWKGAGTPVPGYVVEMGDTPATLALWAQVTAPATIAPQTPPVVIPSGPVIFGNVTTGHTTYGIGGGTVTIATNTFSVSVLAGHTLTVQVLGAIDARMIAWDNYVATPRRGVRAVLSGGIYTGAWQELPFGLTRATYDLSSAPGIALAAGTYTVSIQINTVEYNQMEVFSGWVQAAVVTV